MLISLRVQKALIWLAIAFTAIWGLGLWLLFHIFPPPAPTTPAAALREFYIQHHFSMSLGAALDAFASGFFTLWAAVVAVQIYRHEKSKPPVLTILAAISGTVASVVIALPAVILGVAAFDPYRPAEVTAAIHQLGVLMLVTGDQFGPLTLLSIVIAALIPNSVRHSPFPRWFGYFTLVSLPIFEIDMLPYLFHSGPFAWNGLLCWWLPFGLYGIWASVNYALLIKAINAQMREEPSLRVPEVSVA